MSQLEDELEKLWIHCQQLEDSEISARKALAEAQAAHKPCEELEKK